MTSWNRLGGGSGLQKSGREVVRATNLTDELMLLAVGESRAESAGETGTGGELLSPQELAVARLAVIGLSNLQIAERQGCSWRTIANQLASVYRKLGLSGRRALRAHFHERREMPISALGGNKEK